MLIEEKRKTIKEVCDNRESCNGCPLEGLDDNGHCYSEPLSDEIVDRNYKIMFSETPHIKDSGNRREFDTGAVRDIQEGKGRCDLLPLDVVGHLLYDDPLIYQIFEFTSDGNPEHLIVVLNIATNGNGYPWLTKPDMLLELSKHFEEGAKKYGENNWQKGIPTHCHIDSAVRHYLKMIRGDKDEPHDRAFVWNIVCCIWTCNYKPELNDYAPKEGKTE